MSTALVTGASAGIGRAFAERLAREGTDLVLVARDRTRLDELATGLRMRHGVAVEVLVADLSDREATGRVCARIEDDVRPIDLLVNNAGFGLKGSFLDNDLADEEAGLDVMVRAVMLTSHAAGRSMRARGHGAILNVSSIAGFIANGTYSAEKAFVTVFTEGLAGELAGTGVTATVLCPGFTHTEFHARAGIAMSALPESLWLDADDVVQQALTDVARGQGRLGARRPVEGRDGRGARAAPTAPARWHAAPAGPVPATRRVALLTDAGRPGTWAGGPGGHRRALTAARRTGDENPLVRLGDPAYHRTMVQGAEPEVLREYRHLLRTASADWQETAHRHALTALERGTTARTSWPRCSAFSWRGRASSPTRCTPSPACSCSPSVAARACSSTGCGPTSSNGSRRRWWTARSVGCCAPATTCGTGSSRRARTSRPSRSTTTRCGTSSGRRREPSVRGRPTTPPSRRLHGGARAPDPPTDAPGGPVRRRHTVGP